LTRVACQTMKMMKLKLASNAVLVAIVMTIFLLQLRELAWISPQAASVAAKYEMEGNVL